MTDKAMFKTISPEKASEAVELAESLFPIFGDRDVGVIGAALCMLSARYFACLNPAIRAESYTHHFSIIQKMIPMQEQAAFVGRERPKDWPPVQLSWPSKALNG